MATCVEHDAGKCVFLSYKNSTESELVLREDSIVIRSVVCSSVCSTICVNTCGLSTNSLYTVEAFGSTSMISIAIDIFICNSLRRHSYL